ncbi:MAG: aldo/keto reductase [Eubacteriaceae bacterium]|nr:aldo/keto reductase [Eubacteriaceae bacterium]
MEIKKLGFGCMRLPLKDAEKQDSVDMDQMKKMVDIFMSKGFSYFDTAWMYHDFKSENFLKEALVDRYPRESYQVADKLPIMMMKDSDDPSEIFEKQLGKCGLDFFDVYLIHNINIENYKKAEGRNCFEMVSKKKAEGKAVKIGFSYHADAELLERVLTEHPEVDVVQLQLNYLDWNNERIQSGRCYDIARAHGKEIIVMEPVKGGSLAALPEDAEKILNDAAPHMSPASWAIRFAAGLDGVITVLSGMSDLDQLKDNLSYMEDFKPLSEDENKTLHKTVDEINSSIAIPCTACRYCVKECPQEIAIPEFFSLYNSREQSIEQDFYAESAYYDDYIRTHSKASDCIKCGRCEKACPQHLEIIAGLEKVAEIFEPKKAE